MHRQGQGQEAVRIRLQGHDHHQPLRAGGMFVLHADALHGASYDGHTLGTVLSETVALTG